MSQLRNLVNREELKAKLEVDPLKRMTLSFYRYVKITDPDAMRDRLFDEWSSLGVMGRIYLAHEGINSQMSIPEENWTKFVDHLYSFAEFKGIPFKIAVEDDGKSFYKLTIKVREKVVADGLNDETFDVTNVGEHLDAEKFNELMEDPESLVVDMRNQYESEVGHFEKAICPDVDTFREALPVVEEELADAKDKKILLYCTGGIRCEKASAYFKHKGFKKVYQLHGGIIQYAHEIKEKGLSSKFKGKNFVFDERVGERITDDVLSECHQCGAACDDHTNCNNKDCHLLFIQCSGCKEKYDGCCTNECKEIFHLPLEEQIKLRKGRRKTDSLSVYKSRLRPKLREQYV